MAPKVTHDDAIRFGWLSVAESLPDHKVIVKGMYLDDGRPHQMGDVHREGTTWILQHIGIACNPSPNYWMPLPPTS